MSRWCFSASRPSTDSEPVSGRTSPSSDRISVDLPAPFAPSSPVASPSIASVTSVSASTVPNLFETPVAVMAAGAGAASIAAGYPEGLEA